MKKTLKHISKAIEKRPKIYSLAIAMIAILSYKLSAIVWIIVFSLLLGTGTYFTEV